VRSAGAENRTACAVRRTGRGAAPCKANVQIVRVVASNYMILRPETSGRQFGYIV